MNEDEINKSFHKGLNYGIVIGTIIGIVFFNIGKYLVGVFNL